MRIPGRGGPLLLFEFLWEQGFEFILKYFVFQVFPPHPCLLRNREVVGRIRIMASAGFTTKQQFREFYGLCVDVIELEEVKQERNAFARQYDVRRLAQGDIVLGKLYCRTSRGFGLSDCLVRVALKAFYRGLLLLGMPGSGKSNLWAAIMTQLLPAAKAVHGIATSMMFEAQKGTAVDLLFMPLRQAGIESLVVSDIQFNLLQIPTGVSLKKKADSVAAMLAEACGLPFASRIYAQKQVRKLYKEKRLDFQREYFPNLVDLKQQIEKDPEGGAARTNFLGKLEGLELEFEDSILYSRGLTGEDFKGESVFFPLADYSDPHKALIMQHFAVGEYERRVAVKDLSPLFISLEESGPLVEPREVRERRALVDLARVAREFNIGLIIIHQQAAKVDPSFFSLLNLVMLGNSKADDLSKGVRAAGFPDTHAEWVRENIDDFQWATTCSSLSGKREPLLIGSLPFPHEPAPPLDQIPNEKLKSIRLVKSVDALRLSVQARAAGTASPATAQAAGNVGVLPPQADKCLNACWHPDRSLKDIFQAAGLGTVNGSNAIKFLEQNGYIKTHAVKTGFRTWYKIVEILGPGLVLLPAELRSKREAILALTERGAAVHNHVIRRIAAAFARLAGVAKVVIEMKYTLEGRVVAVDVVITRTDGSAEAYEIEYFGDGGANSSHKLLALPFAKRYLVVPDHDSVIAAQGHLATIDPTGLIEVSTLAGLGGFTALPRFVGDELVG